MDEILKTFSEDVAKELKAKIESADFSAFIEKVQKAPGDDRSFEVVMSTADEDRQGDSLDQSGWDFKYFDMNPVLLWAHNYSSFPIGVINDIKIEGDKTVATGKFAPAGLSAEADLACALYQEKILRAVSPGYIQKDDGSRELLEVSFCPVPAGRHALSLRQVRSLGLSTRDLITKGFFYTTKAADPVLGDSCELEDGTPGVLAEDPKNPKRLVCVPPEQGKSKTDETKTMNEELTAKLEAEQARHGEAVLKQIEQFAEVSVKSGDAGKTIEEFVEKMDAEDAAHLENCLKAVDESFADSDEEAKKAIEGIKKTIEAEHLTHVKAFHDAIDEFAEKAKAGEIQKALEEFQTKAEDELERHGKAPESEKEPEKEEKGLVADTLEQSAEWRKKSERMSYVQTIIYAFCDAYYGSPLESFGELIAEAVQLIQDYASSEGKDDAAFDAKTVAGLVAASIKSVTKSGRSISAKNKEKIESIVKSLEGIHDEHGKTTDTVIAALKELTSSPEGDEGKESADEKSHAPNARSSSAGAAINKEVPISDLDTYLFTQRLLRQVKSASEEGLRQIKEDLKAKFPSRR